MFSVYQHWDPLQACVVEGILPVSVTPLNPVINLLTSSDTQEEDKE
jgi:hypothetical protein